ncbi:MAG: Fe-S-binding domain-containing protein, partial [Pseudomonadota bacterium]
MSQTDFPLLTWVTFFPLLGAAILLFLNKEKKETIRWVTLIVTLLEFAFSLPLFFQFRLDTPAMQFVEKAPWIPEYGMSYFLGIDGISLFLVLLTTFFTFISVIACW